MTGEPLSDFARAILREIALRPAKHNRIAPDVKSLLRKRNLIVAEKVGPQWIYKATDAGRREAGLSK